jgi:hypothetical protein
MSARSAATTPDAVRRQSSRIVEQQIDAIPWLKPGERAMMHRVVGDILPRFAAAIHRERILRYTSGSESSGDVKSAGVMLLSNMLDVLAKNTTVELPGDDRQRVVWAETRRLHDLILDNLQKAEPIETEDNAVYLAICFRDIITKTFAGGGVESNAVVIACLIILQNCMETIPDEKRREWMAMISEKFADLGAPKPENTA